MVHLGCFQAIASKWLSCVERLRRFVARMSRTLQSEAILKLVTSVCLSVAALTGVLAFALHSFAAGDRPDAFDQTSQCDRVLVSSRIVSHGQCMATITASEAEDMLQGVGRIRYQAITEPLVVICMRKRLGEQQKLTLAAFVDLSMLCANAELAGRKV
jgi:hypothetical protein